MMESRCGPNRLDHFVAPKTAGLPLRAKEKIIENYAKNGISNVKYCDMIRILNFGAYIFSYLCEIAQIFQKARQIFALQTSFPFFKHNMLCIDKKML